MMRTTQIAFSLSVLLTASCGQTLRVGSDGQPGGAGGLAGSGGIPASGGTGTTAGPPKCGNGVTEAGEQCDGKDLFQASCADVGHSQGSVTCTDKCQLDTSACHTCGDGIVEAEEECDASVGADTCDSLGESGGQLACTSACKWDKSACYTCGDGACEAAAGETPYVCAGDCAWKAPEVTAAESTSCVRKPDGRAWCWGRASYGQLGNGSEVGTKVCGVFGPCADTPVEVTVVKDLAAFVQRGHGCAVDPSGALRCWGDNTRGQLGIGALVNNFDLQLTPQGVTLQVALDRGTPLALGGAFTCAVDSKRKVHCWGHNDHGQVGHGGLPYHHAVACKDAPVGAEFNCVWEPAEAALPGPANAVTAGVSHACALLASGELYCWGTNENGQLGDGSQDPTSWPRKVIADVKFATVDASAGAQSTSGFLTCATDTSGGVWCWGSNAAGQLGLGHRDGCPTCGIDAKHFPTPQKIPGIDDARVVRVGGDTACVIRGAQNELWCWGSNSWGALDAKTAGPEQCFSGDPATAGCSTKPIPVHGLKNVASVSIARTHMCASKLDGQVLCWGWGVDGVLGAGNTSNSVVPVQVFPPGW